MRRPPRGDPQDYRRHDTTASHELGPGSDPPSRAEAVSCGQLSKGPLFSRKQRACYSSELHEVGEVARLCPLTDGRLHPLPFVSAHRGAGPAERDGHNPALSSEARLSSPGRSRAPTARHSRGASASGATVGLDEECASRKGNNTPSPENGPRFPATCFHSRAHALTCVYADVAACLCPDC